jgi:hypothetical protein
MGLFQSHLSLFGAQPLARAHIAGFFPRIAHARFSPIHLPYKTRQRRLDGRAGGNWVRSFRGSSPALRQGGQFVTPAQDTAIAIPKLADCKAPKSWILVTCLICAPQACPYPGTDRNRAGKSSKLSRGNLVRILGFK